MPRRDGWAANLHVQLLQVHADICRERIKYGTNSIYSTLVARSLADRGPSSYVPNTYRRCKSSSSASVRNRLICLCTYVHTYLGTVLTAPLYVYRYLLSNTNAEACLHMHAISCT